MEMEFIGRKRELQELEERYQSGRFEMGVIYGARRIGKTSLLKKFSEDKPSLYFQARESSELDNRAAFSFTLNRLLGIPYEFIYPTYSEAFDALIRYAGGKPFVLVLDEIAFLAQSDKAFLSELQFNVDHKFKNTEFKFLLSGSTISFMKDILKDNRGPLFQRSTFQMNIRKLYFSDALAFLKGVSSEDKIRYLSMFGEHPFYLEMIDSKLSFDENITRLLFNRFSNLLDAPDKVLPLASKDQNTYNTILKAIAHRRRTNKEIADYIGKDPNFVATYLARLVDNETIEKRESFNKNQKMNYYEISDSLLRFWYRFIFDHKEEIEWDLGPVLYSQNSQEIHQFLSLGFEEVALSYLSEKNVRGELGFHYEPLRSYNVDNSKLGRSVEFDGLAKGIGGGSEHLLVVECKYRTKKLSLSVLEHLKSSLTVFPPYQYDFYLFSGVGFSEDILALKDPSVHLVSLEDMVRASL